MSEPIPIVNYLVLGEAPHLVSYECASCKARFFGRRNACASCFGTEFNQVEVATTGELRSFTIVAFAAPGVEVPFDRHDISIRSQRQRSLHSVKFGVFIIFQGPTPFHRQC